MNKKQVNDWILPAQKAIVECGIAKNGKIDSAFRGQISSFGAAVVMGSLKSSVAFFADDGSAQVKRSKLITAMYFVISGGEKKNPYSTAGRFDQEGPDERRPRHDRLRQRRPGAGGDPARGQETHACR